MAHDTLAAVPRSSVLLALALTLPAHALLIRADRDDAEYLEMATRYDSALWLEAADAGGALIAPGWILTEASAGARIAGKDARVKAVFTSPDQRFALLLLVEPMKSRRPSALYRARDEAGKTVVIASSGPTAKLGDTALHSDHRPRAGVNTVDAVADATLGLRIKALDDASDLQAVATGGDRGSALYIENEDGIFLAGIAAAAQPAAQIGATNAYLRVSTAVGWIEETMLEQAKRDMDRLLDDTGRG